MEIGSLLEAGMLICWGSSWPFQVAKTYRTKNVSGKSILFLWLIETGYILGLLYKTFYHFDYVIILYIVNFVFVAADMILYYLYNSSAYKTEVRFGIHKPLSRETNAGKRKPAEKPAEINV